jgi:hypothetical protein
MLLDRLVDGFNVAEWPILVEVVHLAVLGEQLKTQPGQPGQPGQFPVPECRVHKQQKEY